MDIFSFYISKLNPKRSDLWQHPKRRILDPELPWYNDAPVGKDTLNNVLKKFCIKANVSKIYTKHSLRDSVVDTLDSNNFEARHIMAQTRHKSESSIHQYMTKCPSSKKREMSECLASNLQSQPTKEEAYQHHQCTNRN